MSAKQTALASVQALPEEASWNQIVDRLRYVAAIEEGLQAIEAGHVVPHDEIKQKVGEWAHASSGQAGPRKT